MNRIYRKELSCFILAIIYCTRIFSQGGWDIKYLPLDSLNSSFIGTEIRIDFKSSDIDTFTRINSVFNERLLLLKNNKVNLQIEDKKYAFRENWHIFDDEGFLSGQNLVSIDRFIKIEINEIFLVSMNDSTLTVEISALYKYCNSSEKSKNSSARKKIIVINKSDIKGILVRLYQK